MSELNMGLPEGLKWTRPMTALDGAPQPTLDNSMSTGRGRSSS